MTVFRSKTFKKNRATRRTKGWRKTVRRSKQRGGYVPYRGIPKGAIFADVLDWDDATQA